MDLADCFSSYRKYAGTRSDGAARQIFEDMQSEAKDKEIRLNIRSLLSHGKRRSEVSETFFHEARALADARGIDLYLPPLQAREQRSCPFMADRTTFVAANGDVMPCHFLWHTYSCRLLEDEIAVRERVFGNVSRHPLETIWQERGYAEFRKEAGLYEYSSCWSCPLAPCPSLVNDNVCNLHDCYGSQVPCGHCQWNLGGIRCL
jgi:radical SAM protein with 4Fe4S-binding SPASM domain